MPLMYLLITTSCHLNQHEGEKETERQRESTSDKKEWMHTSVRDLLDLAETCGPQASK